MIKKNIGFHLLALFFLFQVTVRAQVQFGSLPKKIYVESGENGSHVQGVAVDMKRGVAYFSFTTKLIKTDLQGRVLGSVVGLSCHLGCIDLNPANGKLYASIEYKDDNIGRGILRQMGRELGKRQNTFYIGIFDTDKINRTDIPAETGGVMTTVYLPEVVKYYEDTVVCNGRRIAHRYACSGIDGIGLGPQFGKTDGKLFLNVDAALYGDTTRSDNEHQLLLQFDPEKIEKWALPLDQSNPHHSGPAHADKRFFVYTGSTSYGIQNLEYDADTHLWLAAVYPGKKSTFHNFTLFAIDGMKKPVKTTLTFDKPEKVRLLSLAENGTPGYQRGIYGWDFPWGATGLESLGGGYYYISHNGKSKQGHQFCDLRLYRWTGQASQPFEEVK